jgi:AcrR family transcriptional regulator
MKDILAKRKEAERRARIETILRAGRKLFLKKGYSNTTMRDICQASELSTGAVYFYFKGKDEIYARICEESFHILLEMFKNAVKDLPSPMDRLHSLKAAYLKFYSRCNDRWLMLNSGFRNASLAPELLDRIEQLDVQTLSVPHETVIDLLEEKGLSQQYDCMEITIALWASVEGLLTIHNQGYFKNTQLTLEQLVDTQINIFFKGLQT